MTQTQVSVSREIAAEPRLLWAMVSDITRMREWSPEASGAQWVGGPGGAEGPRVGARFVGHNRRGWHRWSSRGEVVEAEPGRSFAFEITSGGMAVARWSYTFEPAPGGCRVEESWQDRRGLVIKVLGVLATGVADRAEHNRATMTATLDNLAAAAEPA
jgi:uncharacterized protein YndB with AHSA1/START domain